MPTACIASIPERSEMLKETIKSLLPQVDHVMLCLNNYDISVANEIQSMSPRKITYVIGDNSKGDAGKFFFVPKIKGYILTCDDDLIFRDNYANKMIAGIEKYNRKAVVSMHGRVMDFPIKKSYYHEHRNYYAFNKELKDDVRCHVIGTGCMAWHTSTMGKFSMKDFYSKNMSDIHFSILAQKRNVPLMVLAHNPLFILYQQPEKTIYKSMNMDDSEHVKRLNAIKTWHRH